MNSQFHLPVSRSDDAVPSRTVNPVPGYPINQSGKVMLQRPKFKAIKAQILIIDVLFMFTFRILLSVLPDPTRDIIRTSIADPDPSVFGPPGSGSISQKYGSIYCFVTFGTFIFENYVYVP